MDALIQTLHPALCLGRQLTLAASGARLFSRQGDWDGGSTLHCVAMALALLGKLPDPVRIPSRQSTAAAKLWDQAWPHYLHGLTLTELASFLWELNAGVRPVEKSGNPAALLRFCTRELASGWPVIVGWGQRHPARHHAALAIGVEARRVGRTTTPQALLLLDPAEAEPSLAGCNARMAFAPSGESLRTACVTATATRNVTLEGAVSIRLITRQP
ncbi:hypothetical protein ACKI2N_032625 [Cupriavidus sp. 30B13]|uniref:hypothetical protein n=1 Tax=Cupriavidus sp. 30B13 TaxID=3384241 RepID=UPI003B913F8A